LQIAFIVALLVQTSCWRNGVVTLWINRSVRHKSNEDVAAATSLAALGFIAKLTLWAVIILSGLANMGVDKPFAIGDFIVVGDLKGSVEQIGPKTTRVRSLSGKQITFSNSDLRNSRARNYKRMYERSIDFTIGVTYDTPTDVLEKIPEMIRAIVETQPNTRFDRSHFKAFGDFSFNFETVHYMLVPNYATYMDTQQAINLTRTQRFEEKGIEFTYPTQILYVKRPLQDEQPDNQRGNEADERRNG